MTRSRRLLATPREPIGLSAEEAAAYLGVSCNSFLGAVRRGDMPLARLLGSRSLWDADELRTAFRTLPPGLRIRVNGLKRPRLWRDNRLSIRRFFCGA